MTEYSSSTGPPRSPLFGTATFSTLSATQTPMSPSRYSSSYRSGTPITTSYDSDDASSDRVMRRIIVSPPPTSRDSDSYTYSDDNSIDEVEAALRPIEDQLDDAQEMLSEWSRGSSRTPSEYTSYTGPSASGYTSYSAPSASGYTSYSGPSAYSSHTPSTLTTLTHSGSGSQMAGELRSASTPLVDRGPRVLSTISEHTENTPSRPTSYAQSGSRPNTMYSTGSGDGPKRLSTLLDEKPLPPIHERSATEPSNAPGTSGRSLPPLPGKKVGEQVAFYEAKATGSPYGHSRTASAPTGPRSPSPFTTQSRSMPTFTSISTGYGSVTGYGSTSRSSSPSKTRTTTSMTQSGLNTTMSSLLSPPPRTASSLSNDSRTYSSAAPRTMITGYTPSRTGTSITGSQTYISSTYRGTLTSTLNTVTGSQTTMTMTPRPRGPSELDAVSRVADVLKQWRQRTPSMKSEKSSMPPSPTHSDGLFNIRRRASRGSGSARGTSRRVSDPVESASVDDYMSTSGLLPPTFDITELGQYAGASETQEPLRIGLLWYLNVHAPTPYRWQRCQALLYPHMLLLSWIAPSGGRGIVTLDLLNCTEVRSTASPTHPSARDDIGTVAARMQSQNAIALGFEQLGEVELMQTLSPFMLMYSDGIERLGADSPRERVRWVSAIWDVIDRAVSIPDRSATGSPTGSIRTVRSFASSATSRSGTGSASTRYIVPDLTDLQSISGSSSLSRQPSLASAHRTRATDDSAVSSQGYLYRGDPRVIGPSRSSSLRRTSSLTDLDEEFASAVRRARDSRPGLGFGLGLAGGIPVGDGSPVTVSSGPRLGRNVYMSPPPSIGRPLDKARSHASDSITSVSDDAFFSGSRTQGSSYYSSSSFTRGLTTTDTRTTTGILTDETLLGITSGTGTNIVASTLSYRGTASASLLGDSQSGSGGTYTSTPPSPSRSGLSRSRGLRRRTGRSEYSSFAFSGTEESSDKENSGSYTNPSGTRSITDGFSTLESYSYTQTGTGTRTYTPTPSSSSYTRSTDRTASDAEPSTDTLPSSDYVTAKTPSELSYVSLPTIPSLYSDYDTAEECLTEYETAPKCPTEPISEYETVEICPTETPTEFITATRCPSEVSTDYETADCRCKKPEEQEEDEISIVAPSAIPTIPSSPGKSEVEMVVRPEDIPLPLSTYSYSPSARSSELLDVPETPAGPPVRSPTPTVISERTPTSGSRSFIWPSPILPTESPLPSLPTISTISTPTETSVTPTPSSVLTPSVPSSADQPLTITPTPSSPAIPESLWAAETDESYDSSLLRASPSIQSVALQEGVDTSFETSFLRPSGSVYSSREVSLLTPITELTPTPSISIASPPSASITPTPSSASLPPSVPSPTPISSEVPVPTVTLTRTPSSVSTASSISMSSSVFEPRSLYDYPMSEVSEPSTEPSLLSTAASSVPAALRVRSPPSVPLPPSPSPSAPSVAASSVMTPSVTMSVSVTTPRGDVPSIMSALETVSSEAPGNILTHDINLLLQYLNERDQERGMENRDMAHNIQEIRRILEELRDNQPQVQPPPLVQLEPSQSPIVVHVPPPVPRKDRSVGGTSVISEPAGPSVMRDVPRAPPSPVEEPPRPIRAPQPIRIPAIPMPEPTEDYTQFDVSATPRPASRPPSERQGPRRVPIPLTPPPMRIRSPDSISEAMSFLSSHHSDDLSLMESESYPAISASPLWPSSSSSSPESLGSEDSISLRSVSPTPVRQPSAPTLIPVPAPMMTPAESPSPSPTPPPSSPTPPPSSPTPSSSSSRTARPAPTMNINEFLEAVAQLRQELTSIRDAQAATNGLLNELRSRPTGQELEDCCHRLEAALQRILDQTSRPPPSVVRDDVSDSYRSASDTSFMEQLARLRDQFARDRPPIQMPAPRRPGTLLDEGILSAMMTDAAVPEQPPIQPPPPLISLTYRPAPRVSRPRSASPVFEADLPVRPGTFPITQPPFIFERPLRPPPRGPRVQPQQPPSVPPVARSEGTEGEELAAPSFGPSGPGRGPRGRPDESDIDFLREVQRRRRAGHPDTDGFVGGTLPEPVPPRPATAPGTFADTRPAGQPGRVPVPGAPVPPPGAFGQVPMAAPPPTVVQLPIDEIITLLREGRRAQLAAIEQNRELSRYMRDFNDWQGRDVADRHREMRSLHARIDDLRDLINDVLDRQSERSPQVHVVPPAEGAPGMPQPQYQYTPGSAVPPPGIMGPAQQPGIGIVPYPPPAVGIQPQYPINVIPPMREDERTPSLEEPAFIPPTPQGPFAPVIPDYGQGQVQPPPPVLYQTQPAPDEPAVIPPYIETRSPSDFTESGSSSEPRSPVAHVIPPPERQTEPMPTFVPGQQPPFIIPPPREQPPIIIQEQSSGSPSASPIDRHAISQSPAPSRGSGSPPPIVVQIPTPPGPTEPRPGTPRHPEAPSSQIPIIIQPSVVQPPSGPVVVRAASPERSRSPVSYRERSPEPIPVRTEYFAPGDDEARLPEPSFVAQPPPTGPPIVVEQAPQPPSAAEPITIRVPTRGEPYDPTRERDAPYHPSQAGDVGEPPYPPSRAGDVGEPPYHPSRAGDEPSYPPRGYPPERVEDPYSQRPPHYPSRSPSPIRVRTQRSRVPPDYRPESGSPTIREYEGYPQGLTQPTVIRVPTSQPPIGRYIEREPIRPDRDRPYDPERELSEYDPEHDRGDYDPERDRRRGTPSRTPSGIARTRSARPQFRTEAGPHAQIERSPSPPYSMEEGIHEAPRSDISAVGPPRLSRGPSRHVTPGRPSPIPEFEPPESEPPESPPVHPVPPPLSPQVIRTRSRAGPPTVIDLDQPETPLPPPVEVVRVPTSRTVRTERTRRPSEVTVQQPYDEGGSIDEGEIQEPRPISMSPSRVSRLGEALEEEDRRMAALSRGASRRTAPAPTELPGSPPIAEGEIHPEEEEDYAPSIARSEYEAPIQRTPTITRIPSQPSAPVQPLGEEEEFPEPLEERPRSVSPPPVPVHVEEHRVSGPGDLGYADAERERQEHFGELERQMDDTLAALQENEERRDQNFRANEDERERLFLEHEERRDQEAMTRRDEIWRELEDRLAAITSGEVPLPVPPPQAPSEFEAPREEMAVPEEEEGAPLPEVPAAPIPSRAADTQSIVESIRSVTQDAAIRHAEEIKEVIRMEREDAAREREMERLERERLMAEVEAERARVKEEQDARIRLLEEELAATREELATTRADLENERQLRVTEENERREREQQQVNERFEAIGAQVSDLTNLLQDVQEVVINKRDASDARWNEKLNWRQMDDERWEQVPRLAAAVEALHQAHTDYKAQWDEDRAARAEDTSLQDLKDEVAALRPFIDDLLRQLQETMRADCAEHNERTLETIRQTAQERIPFNIQNYLDEFSKSLATEVRMLLAEVGKLREEKRTQEYELGCLLKMKAKYGPGGEFDPNWRPPTGACAREGEAAPAPPPQEAPPPPEEPVPARPAWRQLSRAMGSRRSRRNQPAPPPPPEPEPPRPSQSWATWHPDPAWEPSPPSAEAQLLAPPAPSPGLFGPRSPRDSIAR